MQSAIVRSAVPLSPEPRTRRAASLELAGAVCFLAAPSLMGGSFDGDCGDSGSERD
jgi:hypothetical protein